MKNIAKRPWFFLGILILALALGGTIQTDTSEAHGAIVVDGTVLNLTADVDCSFEDHSTCITVINGGHLNLNGFTVTCHPNLISCLQVPSGSKNHVHDGFIDGGCVGIGVFANQTQIHNVTISGTPTCPFTFGILVFNSSKKNRFTFITVNAGRTYGIRLLNGSKQNQIHDSDFTGAAFGAQDLSPGCDKNNWKSNTFNHHSPHNTCIN